MNLDEVDCHKMSSYNWNFTGQESQTDTGTVLISTNYRFPAPYIPIFTGTGLISKNYRFTAQQIPIFTGTGLICTSSIAYLQLNRFLFSQEQDQSLQPQLQVYSPINSYTYRNGIQVYNPNYRKIMYEIKQRGLNCFNKVYSIKSNLS